jgi:hypothetical protein
MGAPMADEHGGGAARTVNLWVQTFAFLLAGIWGIYVFVYQEFSKPATAPINLTTQISVRPAGVRPSLTGPDGKPLLAIELEVTATNPSTRIVYILPSYWVAHGINVAPRPLSIDWIPLANDGIRNRAIGAAGEHYGFVRTTLVASGSAIPDTELKPNESVTRSFVFYVPEGAYDLLDVESVLPSASRNHAMDIDWSLTADGSVQSAVYRLDPQGGRQQIQPDQNGDYGDNSADLQQAVSRRQLSLWRER